MSIALSLEFQYLILFCILSFPIVYVIYEATRQEMKNREESYERNSNVK